MDWTKDLGGSRGTREVEDVSLSTHPVTRGPSGLRPPQPRLGALILTSVSLLCSWSSWGQLQGSQASVTRPLLAAHDWAGLACSSSELAVIPPQPRTWQRSRFPGDLSDCSTAPGDLWCLSELSFGFLSGKRGIKLSLCHVPRGLGDPGRVQ